MTIPPSNLTLGPLGKGPAAPLLGHVDASFHSFWYVELALCSGLVLESRGVKRKGASPKGCLFSVGIVVAPAAKPAATTIPLAPFMPSVRQLLDGVKANSVSLSCRAFLGPSRLRPGKSPKVEYAFVAAKVPQAAPSIPAASWRCWDEKAFLSLTLLPALRYTPSVRRPGKAGPLDVIRMSRTRALAPCRLSAPEFYEA